jgi:putative transposase
LRGLVTYYVPFFIHLESRRVDVAGITAHLDEPWMEQIARNVTMDGWGIRCGCRYLLHDRDTKYSAAFRAMIESAHIDTFPLLSPARPKPKFECPRETMGSLSQGRVPVEDYSPLANDPCGGR